MLVLLSGPIGCGKTTLCRRLADAALDRGLAVSGILAPAIVEEGVKVGIQAADLVTGDVRLLARIDRDLGGARAGRYSFDDAAFEWMASACADALAGDTLVLIDEIGPLELLDDGGLACLIPLLAQQRRGSTVVVVRESLLDRMAARLAPVVPSVITVDAASHDQVWACLASALFGDGER